MKPFLVLIAIICGVIFCLILINPEAKFLLDDKGLIFISIISLIIFISYLLVEDRISDYYFIGFLILLIIANIIYRQIFMPKATSQFDWSPGFKYLAFIAYELLFLFLVSLVIRIVKRKF